MTREERIRAIRILAGTDIAVMVNMRLERESSGVFRLTARNVGLEPGGIIQNCIFSGIPDFLIIGEDARLFSQLGA